MKHPCAVTLPLPQVNKLLASLYEQVHGMPRLADGEPADDSQENVALDMAAAVEPLLSLDDLPVIASVTSRWPLPSLAVDSRPEQEVVSEWRPPDPSTQPPAIVPLNPAAGEFEEETDEMDVLNDGQQETR